MPFSRDQGRITGFFEDGGKWSDSVVEIAFITRIAFERSQEFGPESQ
jgi:hypothetical protein